MNVPQNRILTSFADHLDDQYGKPGTATREQYEEEYESFKYDAILQKPEKE